MNAHDHDTPTRDDAPAPAERAETRRLLPWPLPFTRPDIDEAVVDELAQVLASGWLTTGPKVRAFEAALSSLFDDRPVVSFVSGTAALEAGLRLAGVGPGDEVITSALTWVATANVIAATGARPVFADIDPLTRNLDLAAVAAAITPRTRALMPVHLAGLPLDMTSLYDLARRHDLRVIEDAAQAIDSRWQGHRIGSFGDLVCFSFHANKNITCGEGGCLVVSTSEEATAAERFRLQGLVRSGEDEMDVIEPGIKANLTDLSAVIGLSQLRQLDAITARRRHLADRYFEATDRHGLRDLGIELPRPTDLDGARTNWHMFQVVLPAKRLDGGRADVMKAMRDKGFATGVHYPPAHLFTFYRAAGWREGMLPRTERVGRGILTLPLFPTMADHDVEQACAALKDVVGMRLR